MAYAAAARLGTPDGSPIRAIHGLLPAATMLACMTAGAVPVMWLPETVDGHGFCDGAAILLATPIAAALPGVIESGSKRFGERPPPLPRAGDPI